MKRWVKLSRLFPVALLLVAANAHQRPDTPFVTAEKYYAEHSYSAAYENYRKALKTGEVPLARRDEIRLRIVFCLGECKRWDEALSVGLEFVKAHKGTIWEPRGLSQLGRLYFQAPHWGYRVEGKVGRFEEGKYDIVNRLDGLELHAQDVQNSRDAFEAACVLFPKYRGKFHTETDEIQNAYDLCRLLDEFFVESWASKRDWTPMESPGWRVDTRTEFNTKWPLPKKLTWLYAHIRKLAGTNSHQVALGLFGNAVWLRNYHGIMPKLAWSEDWQKPVWKPYPYEDFRAESVLSALISRFPNDPLRDQAEMMLATCLMEQGKMKDAEAAIKHLLHDHPKSIAVPEANYYLKKISAPEITFHTPGATTTTKRAKLIIKSRNLAKIHFEAFRFDLPGEIEKFGSSGSIPYSPMKSFRHIDAERFLSQPGFEAALGQPEAVWDELTGDPGDHLSRTTNSRLPISRIGAYIVRATAPGIRVSNIALVTDLVVVKKTHGPKELIFVADAITGNPVTGAEIAMCKSWYVSDKADTGEVRYRVEREKTSPQGIADMSIRTPEIERPTIQVVVRQGDRIAVFERDNSSMVSRGTDESARVFIVTDRAVYRPGHPVHYRVIASKSEFGAWKPLVNMPVTVKLSSQQDKPLLSTKGTTNAFGSFSGEFQLPSDITLGRNSLTTELNGVAVDWSHQSGGTLQIEEYKKPEFRVIVSGAKKVRVGERATAIVKAEYFFGAPVVGAKVRYRIYPGESYHYFDWSMTSYGWNPFRSSRSARSGSDTMTAQGEAVTDGNGEARITFATSAKDARTRYSTYSGNIDYSVEADVQDLDRNTITGTGEVTASRKDFWINSQALHGYFRQGEPVEIKLATTDDSGAPVEAHGEVTISPMVWYEPDKKRIVTTLKWSTDKTGRGTFRWSPTVAGHLHAQFTARDSHESEIVGGNSFWVDGPNPIVTSSVRPRIGLVRRSSGMIEGGVVNFLLVAPANGCTVLLTREADHAILGHEVIAMTGKTMEISRTLTSEDVPDVTFNALFVHDGDVIEEATRLSVKARASVSKVTMSPDSSKYEPGQRARIALHAQDVSGQPIRTEVSVSVSDASLTAFGSQESQSIGDFIQGGSRHSWIGTTNALNTRFAQYSPLKEERGNYGVKWERPTGMGRLKFGEYDYYSWKGLRIDFNAPDAEDLRSGKLRRPPRSQFGRGMGGAPTAGMMVNDQRKGERSNSDSSIQSNNPADLMSAVLRKRFEDTAFWIPSVITDEHGNATVEFTWPDNLTEWDARAVGISESGQVGEARVTMQTRKDLLIRPETPRFLVAKDEVTFSGIVHNYLPVAARVLVGLELGGGEGQKGQKGPQRLKGIKGPSIELSTVGGHLAQQWVTIPSGGDKRVDWKVNAMQPGLSLVRMSARSTRASDAAEIAVPVIPHGVERVNAVSGTLDGKVTRAVTPVIFPVARSAGSSEVVVHLNSGLESVIVDALPYLAEYPYGCIEQTMSRFLPCVIVSGTLNRLGIDLEALRLRLSLPTSFNQRPEVWSKQMVNPVFNKAVLDDMVSVGLKRILTWQHKDGGWGWWLNDKSNPAMTAYVLNGLIMAKEAGVPVDSEMLAKGITYLRAEFIGEKDLQLQVEEARVLALDPVSVGVVRMVALRLFVQRDKLGFRAKSLLASTLQAVGEKDKAQVVLRNIENPARVDEQNGIVHWDIYDDKLGKWNDTLVETNTAILNAYLDVQPNSRNVPMLAKWIGGNRTGSNWGTTRETALAVLAISRFVKSRWDDESTSMFIVDLGGRVHKTVLIDRKTALLGISDILIPDADLRTGRTTLTITKTGKSPFYWSVETRYYSKEEPIREAQTGITIKRRYYRIVTGTAKMKSEPVIFDENRPNPFLTGHYEWLVPVAWGEAIEPNSALTYKRVPLKPGESIASGDMIEVEIEMDANNHYNYVMVEDMKPAGCEPVELKSGYHGGQGVWSHMELRDQKVAFFMTALPQGKRALTYKLRAVTPGQFHVMPAKAVAMYAPKVGGISGEWQLLIGD